MKRIVLFIFLIVPFICVFAESEAELFSEAEKYYRAGNYLLALDIYTELVNQYPLSDRVPDTQYRRAVSLFRLKNYQEALVIFEDIEKRYRSTRYFDYITFWQGVALYRLGDFSKAVDALSVFLNRVTDPDLNPQALLYKSLAQVSYEHYRDAALDLKTLVDNYFESSPGAYGLILLFYVYLKQDRYEDILEQAEQIDEEQLPLKWRSRFKLYKAEALWGKGNLAKASDIYVELLNSEDDIASISFRRLFINAQREKNLSVMEDLIQKAEIRFSGSPKVLKDLWVRVGIESFKQNNQELSEYFFTKVWNLPDRRLISQAVPLYLAEIFINKDDKSRAEEILEDYLSAKPDEAALVLMRLGDVSLMQEDFQNASSHYSRYMKEYPSSERYAEAGYLQAYSQYRLGSFDSARKLTQDLLKGSPEGGFSQELYRLQIILERKTGDSKAALQLLRKYTSLFPMDLKGRIDFLKSLFTFNEFQEIILETDSLFQEFPLLHDQDLYVFLLANYLRGLSGISVKDYAQAISALSVISADEANETGLPLILPYVHYYQGWAYYRMGKFKEARNCLLQLLEQYPAHKSFAQGLFLAGWCSFSLGEYQAAVSYFSRLAKMNSNLSSKAAFLQGKSLQNMDDLKEASLVFKNLLTIHPVSPFADDALFEYAGTLLKMGKVTEAAAGYWDLAEQYPQSPLAEEALFKRGEVLQAAGLFEQARDAYFEYRSRFPRGKLVDASLYWGGLAAFELGEQFGAVLNWEKIIDKYRESPFRPDALYRTAEAYAGRGDFRKALDLFIAIIEEYPEKAEAIGADQRADEVRYQLEGLSDQEAALSAIIGREGGARTARGREAMIELSRIYIYVGGGRLNLAFEMLTSIINKIDKDEPESASQAQYLMGEYYYRKSDPVQAAKEFLKAASLNPDDGDLMAASMFRAAEMMHLAGKERDVRELVMRLKSYFPDSQWTVEAEKLLDREGGE